MAREIVSFRLAPETKRQFFAQLALRGQKAQDFFEETVKNFLEDDTMTNSPYILIRKSGEPVARIPVDMDEDSLAAGSPEICEIVRSHGYPCIESELEFLPREREAQGPDTPARVIVDVEEHLRCYAIIDNHSGYLWETARAETPEAACRKIDGHVTPDAERQYVPVFTHELAANDTAYHVFELDRATYDSLRDADGQDSEAIQAVNDHGELAEVFKIEGKED